MEIAWEHCENMATTIGEIGFKYKHDHITSSSSWIVIWIVLRHSHTFTHICKMWVSIYDICKMWVSIYVSLLSPKRKDYWNMSSRNISLFEVTNLIFCWFELSSVEAFMNKFRSWSHLLSASSKLERVQRLVRMASNDIQEVILAACCQKVV